MEELIRAISNLLSTSKVRNGELDYIEEARDKAEVLEYHFDTDYPDDLLRTQHPSEEAWMKEYRRRRWQPVTMSSTGRIYTFLQKIQQADDFKIKFKKDFADTGIVEVVDGQPNTLADYVTFQLPKFKNLETWTFNVFLKTYLQDANAIVLMLPDINEWIEEPELIQLDFTKPFPQIFSSEDLIYENDNVVIVKVEEYSDASGKEWDQFMAVHEGGILLYRQVIPYEKGIFSFEIYSQEFNFRRLPIVKVGNIIDEVEDGHLLYDSVLAPCLPAWNEALYRTDDLNIIWAIHALPQKWMVKTSNCKTCKGSGQTKSKNNELIGCGTCNGSGLDSATPFGVVEVNLPKASALQPNPVNIPTPPMGYVERPLDSVDAFKKDIEDKIYQGFQAIGLEILTQIPSNQSGIAKEYDRKEINTFCYSVAVHLAAVYEHLCELILLQRYSGLVDSGLLNYEKQIAALPQITVPTDFDVLTTSMIGEMLSTARTNNFNPIIINGIEMDYTEKLYGENSYQLTVLKLVNKLDPLPFKKPDEKMAIKESMGCTEIDYIMSTYLPAFIAQLIDANPDFVKMPMPEQKALLVGLSQIKLDEIKAGIVPIMPVG
jgi:hypothetical protein